MIFVYVKTEWYLLLNRVIKMSSGLSDLIFTLSVLLSLLQQTLENFI